MEILKQVLEVDKELNHKIVNRSLEITDDQFLLKYESLDPKKLRSAITNMIENMVLVLRTIEEFH